MVKLLSPKCAQHAEQWRESAALNLKTAEDLRAVGRDWPSVYWHAGFAVENILKAIRVKRDGLEEWPLSDRGKTWHDLNFIMDKAGLRAAIKMESGQDQTFAAYWLTVKDWKQERRYPGDPPTELEARDLLKAVANPTSGIMRWLLRSYHSI
jgi:hypothetical protein